MADTERIAPEGERDVLDRVADAMSVLESHPDDAVRDAVRELLEGIDAVHRAGLTHLVQAIHGMAGEPFMNRLTADPAIRLLLMSYGLVAVDRRLQAEEAIDTVRGHLHDHGADVEILEVVGGVVYVRLHLTASAAQPERAAAAARDVEAALRAHFTGFQELVLRERERGAPATQLVPLDALRRAHKPVYEDALGTADLPAGALRAIEIRGAPILLANVDGDLYAIRNRCGDSPLPLEFGTLEGHELTCPWHRCRYDVRTGRRLDVTDERVQSFPVAVEGERIRIAVGVAPAERVL